MYENILIPTTGSEVSSRAVPHALDMAGIYGATLHALCVVSRSTTYGDFTVGRMESEINEIRKAADRIVNDVADQADEAGVECVTAVSEGDPSENILDYAESNDIDLIVMGGRKRSPAGKMLFGSVTQSVILHADVPVTVV